MPPWPSSSSRSNPGIVVPGLGWPAVGGWATVGASSGGVISRAKRRAIPSRAARRSASNPCNSGKSAHDSAALTWRPRSRCSCHCRANSARISSSNSGCRVRRASAVSVRVLLTQGPPALEQGSGKGSGRGAHDIVRCPLSVVRGPLLVFFATDHGQRTTDKSASLKDLM